MVPPIMPRAHLKAEINDLIHTYKTEGVSKPPFTTAELVVMAMVCSDSIELTEEGILRWIMHVFPYFARQAVEAYVRSGQGTAYGSYNRSAGHEGTEVVKDLTKALEAYDMPLTTTEDRVRTGYNTVVMKRHRVHQNAARIYLHRLLEPQRKGSFRFLDLPPELRNSIYEMLFDFGPDGLEVRHTAKGVRLRASVREVEPPKGSMTGLDTTGSPRYKRALPPPARILAPLLVCKQVCEEALPFFYRDNAFHFTSMSDIASAIYDLASPRLQHLSTVHISMLARYGTDVTTAKSSLRALGGVKQLKQLVADVHTDDEWLKMTAYERRSLGVERSRMFTSVEQIPLLAELAYAASFAEESTLVGNCPKIKTWVTSEIKRLKGARETVADAMPAEVKTKRKRESARLAAKSVPNGEGVQSARKRTRRQTAGSGGSLKRC